MGLKRILQSFSAVLAGVSLLALGLGGPALAQEDDEDAFTLEEIKVTAQFREQPVQSTPIAITAVTGEEMLARGFTDIAQISVMAPNVTITGGGSAYGASATAYIRGIGQYDTNFAYEPGVSMYVDDVYHGILNGSFFDLLDLDRVEVLRGPQGTLAGKNSIGGAIKLYSKKPMGDGRGYLQATTGSFSRIDLRGAVDQSLIEDKLAVRVSGYSKRRDGHLDRLDYRCARPAEAGDMPSGREGADSCKIGTLGAVKAWGLRANVLWTPTEDFSVNIIGSTVRDDSEAAAAEQKTADSFPVPYSYNGVPYDSRFLPDREYVSYSTFLSRSGRSFDPLGYSYIDSISGTIDWKISDNFAIKSITGYEEIESAWVLDTDGSPLPYGMTLDRQPYKQFTQELRLLGNIFDDMLEYTVGAFYFDAEGSVDARVDNLGFIQKDPVDTKSKAAYAHLVFHPMERMNVIGGIRYTDDEKTYHFARLDADTLGPAAIPFGLIDGVNSKYSGDSWDYRLALQYELTDDIMAYGQYSTGYKGGGVNPRPFTAPQALPFDPETVDAYEVGVKTDLFNHRMFFNVSAFLNKFKNIILLDQNGYPGVPGDPDYFFLSAAPFNAGDADIKGIELETTIAVVDGLMVQGSLSYLDFEYQRLDQNATDSGIDKNTVPPFTPELTWSLLASYEFSLPGGAVIIPQVDANYMDDIFTDPENRLTNHLSDYTLTNARISYRSPSEDWEVIVGVTNLTDKHYYVNAFDLATTNGTRSFIVARPREYYLTLRRNF